MKKSLYEYCMEQDASFLLVQWDKQKNGDLTAHDVSYGSHKSVWWLCEKGHEWEAAVYSRTTGYSGCPVCTGRLILQGINDLAATHPQLAKQWHPVKNFGATPETVSSGSHRKAWWICEKGHEWQAQIKSRSSGAGCPVCSNRALVRGFNDLSFTHPEIAAQWHPNKNGNVKPTDVMGGTKRKIWWVCEKGHEWYATVFSRTTNGSGCPYCSGKLVMPGETDLASLYPHIAEQWHSEKNGEMRPETVSAYSNRKVWWICERGHEYCTAVSVRTSVGSGCPYCAGRKVLEGFNDLATVQPQIAAQWHRELNGAISPQTVTSGSRKKVWWQCAEGHVWKAAIYSRTGAKKHGCPVCAGVAKRARSK